MAELEWRGPKNVSPAGRKRPFDVEEISDQLRAKPGEWAMIWVHKDSRTTAIRKWFGSGFEVIAENAAKPGEPKRYEHFARYVGREETKAEEPQREPGEVKTVRGAFGCGRCKVRFSTPAERDAHERGCKDTRSTAKAIGR